MKIRTKSIIIFLVLSLLPLAIIGMLVYKNGEDAIKKSLGSSFQQIAQGAMDKVDRSLYEVYRNVETWARLELMQEVITGDVDGKISSFLMRVGKEYGIFSSIDVLDSKGDVVASSRSEFIGRNFSQKDCYKNTIGGKPYVEDVYLNELTNEWVVTFSFPIMAEFEEDKIIGVLSAKWSADALFDMTQIHKAKGEGGYHGHIMLIRGDGLIISAPAMGNMKKDIFKRNLIKLGLQSAVLASQRKEGYLVEADAYHNQKSLIGYAYSNGYRDFHGLGWSSLVLADTKTAFAPVEQLKIMIFGIGTLVATFVIIVSFIIAHRVTRPILQISRVATEVAHGDFEKEIDYNSADELGSLAASFNKMIGDLKILMQKQKKLAAAEAAAEVERKRAQELERAYKELKETKDMLIQAEKMGAIGRLASGIAHEVKNPLAIILAGVQYLPRVSNDEQKTSQILEDIKIAVQKADTIVRGLLNFSRISKLEIGTQNLNSLVYNSLLLMQSKIDEGRIEVVTDYDKVIPYVDVDVNKMDQVFTNLFMNAIHAMSDGGKLTVKTYQKKLTEYDKNVGRRSTDIFRSGETVGIIEIEDTGCGIPDDAIDKIFEPFFTTRRSKGGTGLGLSMVKNIIDMHNGAIYISNKKRSRGIMVRVVLKIHSEATKA